MESPFGALTDLKVLIVEDEAIILMMLEGFLEEFGCIVEVAPSIGKALEALHKSTPDGVLLDMNIHGKKPIAVAEALVSRSVPFLLVTGYGIRECDPPVIRAAPRLQKPFTVDELGQRMMELFAHGPDGRVRRLLG